MNITHFVVSNDFFDTKLCIAPQRYLTANALRLTDKDDFGFLQCAGKISEKYIVLLNRY